MPTVIKVISDLIQPYNTYIIGIIALILFVGIAIYIYNNYFLKRNANKKFSDVANANDRSPSVEIFFFSVDWCPHCKVAKPEWDKFKRQYNNTVVNNHTVICYDIDCTDDNGDNVIKIDPSSKNETGLKETSFKTSELISMFSIDAYPTIIMKKGNDTINFDSKITEVALSKFVNGVI